jgi:hypothetical protein
MRKSNYILIAIVLFLLIPSCVGTKVRDDVLIPAIQGAWINVQKDIQVGLDDAVLKGDIKSDDAIFTIFAMMDKAVKSGVRNDIKSVPFNVLEPYAYRGIQVRIADGSLTPGTAELLEERIEAFRDGLDNLMKETVYWNTPERRTFWVHTDSGSRYYGYNLPPSGCIGQKRVSNYMKFRYGEGKYYDQFRN